MKRLIAILILFIPLISFAQQCNCPQNLEYTITHVKADYAGFNDKVKSNQRKTYEKFVVSLKKRALQANSVDSCYVLLRTFTNYFKDNHLRVQLDWRYRKQYPESAKKLAQQFAKPVVVSPSTEKLEWKTSFKILDDKTILLRLPSFEWSEKQIIDSLLNQYKSSLENIPHWIIDLRGNTGGTDYAFSGLIPYIYSGTIKIKPDEYLSSTENIKILTENLKDEELSQAGKDFLVKLIDLMKQHPNQFVNPSGKESFDITRDTIYKYPAKVAILIDRNTASSAESFLLSAVQSKKVKLYGENSAGTLDYNNTQFFDIPCKDFNLVIPIGRSKRLPENPIDNIGLKPTVRIDAKEMDKVNYVKQAMER